MATARPDLPAPPRPCPAGCGRSALLAAVLLLAAAVLLAGCGGGPAAAFTGFARALERRDFRAAYALLAPAEQEQLQAAAAQARSLSDGAWTPAPWELLGRARAVRPTAVSVVAEDGVGALLKVRVEGGREHAVEMVRALGEPAWRVVLAGAEPGG